MVKNTAAIILLLTLSPIVAACVPQDSNDPTPSTEQTSPVDPTDTAGEVVTLYVGPEQVDCVGVAPQTCLLVRESAEAEYSYFYSSIEGFEYEPGYNYELLVEKIPVENPPADGASIQWRLIEVVEQTPPKP